MIVLVTPGADVAAVERALRAMGAWTKRHDRAVLIERGSAHIDPAAVRALAGVADVLIAPSPHPLVDAMSPWSEGGGAQGAAGVARGGAQGGAGVAHAGAGVARAAGASLIIAGPCAVESEAQIHRIARAVKDNGARMLRGGAFKPRTSPHAFQGHGLPALQWLADAGRATDLGVVTECLSEGHVDAVAAVADVIQVGSRSMHHAALLRAVGAAQKPVLLKRAMSATIDEWLLAAEALLAAGAPSVAFVERGIRSFDSSTRNVLDVGAVALLAARGLTVVVDPSHAAGRSDLVVPLARAGLAAGAHGVLVEVHDAPGEALSDGPQAVAPAALKLLR